MRMRTSKRLSLSLSKRMFETIKLFNRKRYSRKN